MTEQQNRVELHSTIVAMIFFPSSSSPDLAPISMNYWFYVLLYLTSLSPSWSFSAPTSSSVPAASTFIPRRQIQRLEHRQLPHLRCCCFLCVYSIHVPETITCEIHGPRKNVLCVLYYCFAHAESPDQQLRYKDVSVFLMKILDRRIFLWSDIIWTWYFRASLCLLYCMDIWFSYFKILTRAYNLS